MVTIAIIALGVVSFTRLPLRLVPEGMSSSEINMWVSIRTSMTPREAEESISQPLEELLRTIPGLKHVRSYSSSGGCRFTIELDAEMDPTLASAEVRDRAQRAQLQWPEGVGRPFTWREDGGSAPLAFIQLLAPERSPEWDYLVDQVIRARLEAVDGVGRVEIWGLLDETIRIWFDRDALIEHRIDYGALLARLRNDNFTTPAGELDNGSERYLIRIETKFKDQAEIENYPVQPGLTIKDIARVERVPSVRDRLSRFSTDEGSKYTYTGILRATSGVNPVDTSRRVREAMAAMKEEPRLEGVDFRFLFDQGEMIEQSLDTLLFTSMQGGLLALVALFMFLHSVRFTATIAISIPLALLMSGAYLFFTKGSLNILTMAGMTLAVGMVVDNSVVVLENIRRLREKGMPLDEACVTGAHEVVLPLTIATLTTIAVGLPFVFMISDPNLRTLFSALGMPLFIALLGSLAVAVLLLPAGVRVLGVGHEKLEKVRNDWKWSPITWLTRFNHRLLEVSLRHRILAVIACLVVLATMMIPAKLLDFAADGGGPFQGGDMQVLLEIPSGMTLADVDQRVKEYENHLLDHKEEWSIDSISVRYSRKDARFDINLIDSIEKQDVGPYAKTIKDNWPRHAGINIKMRETEGGQNGGSNSAEQDERNFVVRVYGPDSEYLAHKAIELSDRLSAMPEVDKVDIGEVEGNKEVIVEVDRDRASELNVGTDALTRTMYAGLGGQELTRFEEDQREVRLIAQYDSERNPTLWDLKETKIWGGRGVFQRLGDMTNIRFKKALGSIRRLDGKTSITIVGERAEGIGAREFSSHLQNTLSTITLPRGYSWTEASKSTELEEQLTELLIATILMLVLLLLIMGTFFESVILPFAILVTVPFAIFGALWSLLLFYGSIEVMAAIGVMLLCGVVVNNGIVLLDCIERLRRDGLDRSEAILQGTRIRLRPIVMTAMTTIVGLLPMALLGQSTGQGVSYVSMSIAVAGGLAFCTVFTAFAVPLAYSILDDISNWLRGTFKNTVWPFLPEKLRTEIEAQAVEAQADEAQAELSA